METFRKKQIGKVCEISMDEILSQSVESLIDQGKRFTLKRDEEEYEDDNV